MPEHQVVCFNIAEMSQIMMNHFSLNQDLQIMLVLMVL